MKRLFFLPSFFLCAVTVFAADEKKAEPRWEVIKGKHFLVYYQKSASIADTVAVSAERHYEQMAANLGFTKRDNFWLWENRVSVYLFPDHRSFVDGESTPEWAAGKSSFAKRMIAGYETNDSFADSVLPHELAHLFFREFVGFKKDIPVWLNEGVAQLQEKGKKEAGEQRAAGLLAAGKLLSLGDLAGMDQAALGGLKDPRDFYAESVSVVGFMLGEYGAEKFRKFSGELRDGRSFDEALKFTYTGSISTIKELEREWKRHLEALNEKK